MDKAIKKVSGCLIKIINNFYWRLRSAFGGFSISWQKFPSIVSDPATILKPVQDRVTKNAAIKTNSTRVRRKKSLISNSAAGNKRNKFTV